MMTTTTNDKARLAAAIEYWKSLKAKTDGERRLVRRTLRDLEARLAAL
jgi:hypothetical protein